MSTGRDASSLLLVVLIKQMLHWQLLLLQNGNYTRHIANGSLSVVDLGVFTRCWFCSVCARTKRIYAPDLLYSVTTSKNYWVTGTSTRTGRLFLFVWTECQYIASHQHNIRTSNQTRSVRMSINAFRTRFQQLRSSNNAVRTGALTYHLTPRRADWSRAVNVETYVHCTDVIWVNFAGWGRGSET